MTSIAQSPPEVALRIHGVSKVYRLWSTPAARLWVPLLLRLQGLLRRPLPRLAQHLQMVVNAHLRYHHALHNVDFSLHRGDALGIIGLNGSGKSTLLQIIAGVLQPSSGTVSVHGRIAALLELGSGFNMEMTGRENVTINAAVLGMSRAQIAARMDDIIAFADIGEYVDQPVKTYSSGMVMRLAFAVQVHVEPDILIVDEALSVGDARFQAKAMARIDEILSRGTTLLFVGHDLNAVRAFCQQAILLERGRMVLQAPADDVVTEYLFRINSETLRSRGFAHAAATRRMERGFGAGQTGVERAVINGTSEHVTLNYGQEVVLQLTLRMPTPVPAPYLILDINDNKGLQVSGRRIPLPQPNADERVRLTVRFEAALQQGIYRINLRIVDAPRLEQTTTLSRQDVLSFDIVDDSRALFTGLFRLPMIIETR